MNDQRHQPDISSCLVWGTIGTVVISILIYGSVAFALPFFSGVFAEIFLFIPDRIGITDRVKPQEKIHLAVPSQYEIKLSRDGRYNIYTQGAYKTGYQVTLVSQTTGESVYMRPISRLESQHPDSFYSLGSPYTAIFEFDIGQAGDYTVQVGLQNKQGGNITIAPDVPPNDDFALIVSILLQSAIVVLIVRGIHYQLNKEKTQAAAAAKRDKSKKFDEWLDGYKA